MDEITAGRHFDKLTKRREQVVMTLQHIAHERRQVEQNTDWLDQAAYKSRVNLLDRLTGWYRTEMDDIDKALLRIASNKYGLCVACHALIEAQRLETVPEAEFCAACEAMREGLEAGA
jgi:DnaK suppressor protein